MTTARWNWGWWDSGRDVATRWRVWRSWTKVGAECQVDYGGATWERRRERLPNAYCIRLLWSLWNSLSSSGDSFIIVAPQCTYPPGPVAMCTLSG